MSPRMTSSQIAAVEPAICAAYAGGLLGIKTDTLGHRVLRGGLPLTVHRTPGGQRRYLRSEVQAYATSVTAGYEAAEAGQ